MEPNFFTEFFAAAKQGPRIFFAPFIGAINAMRSELRRSNKEGQLKSLEVPKKR